MGMVTAAIVGRRPAHGRSRARGSSDPKIMPSENRRYDLVLVLSTEADDERRAKIVTDAEAQITAAGGEVTRNDDWHLRPLSFEIDHQQEGDASAQRMPVM